MTLYDNTTQMEPLLPDREVAEEKAITLMKLSHELSAKLHPITRAAVGRLLELMNSYYSNLIEGNQTKPLDIEKAQKQDYQHDPKKRALQIEASAHIDVQREFETTVRNNPSINICSSKFLCDIHQAYYEKLPIECRNVKEPNGNIIEVIPGKLRTTEVEVGHHLPPTATSIHRFLEKFEQTYDPNAIGSSINKIIAAAASHHRLAWVHPFIDGNGRVARLFTHLYFIRADVDSNGLWALSRGIARERERYYEMLENADHHRYNDYDGRGNLSLRGFNEFTGFVLDTAIDQVRYMSQMVEIDTIQERLRRYARLLAFEGKVSADAEYILIEIFLRGEVQRSDLPMITGIAERTVRRITKTLSERNLIVSETALSPWRLNFPVETTPYIFPSLFPVV